MGYINDEGETEGLGLINASGQHKVYATANGRRRGKKWLKVQAVED